MSDNQRQVDRRELLKATGTVAAAGLLSVPDSAPAQRAPRKPNLRPPLTINPDQ